MSPLEAWVANPAAGALGWTLLDSLWHGAIVAAVLAAALATLRSPRARYAAACVALLVMLGAFGITLAERMPAGSDFSSPATRPVAAWNVTPAADDGAHFGRMARAVPWLGPLWAGGVWLYYLGHAAGCLSVFRLRRRGVCCAPERWQADLARLRTRLRLSRPVELLESCLAETPMVLGHLRPVILVPVGLFAGLPAGQMESILLHELAHIRRHDYLVNMLQRLVEGLFFYHPAVWWIGRVIRAEREHCCDDMVVAVTGDAHEYAGALAALEQNRWSGREAAVAATGGSLVKRIRRLLYPNTSRAVLAPLFAAFAIIATAAAATAAWQVEPAPRISANSAYMKWLNEDVLYIITDQERGAYLKLATDEEREKFIEQFWLRRDPTPGTPQNEFKVEHYRRIAYASRFNTISGKSGWRTDRGHMYIVYGPPDQIDVRPRGVEVWTYGNVEGIGENVSFTFIDRNASGDYQLAPTAPKSR